MIEGAETIAVRLRNGESYQASVVASDEESDVAIIKIEPTSELTPVVFGSSDDLKVGDSVVAIGNPLGELGGSVTEGIISALDREVTIEDKGTFTVLQTSAAINSGNSGGGLFNRQGELIGMVNAKASEVGVEGLGFALPIDDIKGIIAVSYTHLDVYKRQTRTRCAFEVAALDEGAHVTFLDAKSSQMGKKESLADTAKVLGRFYDGIEYRGYDQQVVEDLAKYAGVPVWNGLTDVDHPTQALADVMTIEENINKPLNQVRLAFCGDTRNNVAYCLMYICAKMGMSLSLIHIFKWISSASFC